MSVENATYINQLDETAPDGDFDYKYEGDDHIRKIKEVIKNTFPNITSATVATHSELSLLDGFTYLGSAAARDAGSAEGNVCLLGSVGGVSALPAIDGSRLTGVTGITGNIAEIDLEDTHDGWFMAFHFGAM